MEFGIDFWIQMVVYAVSLGSFSGVVLTRLNYLEKKMDKHNNFMERLTKLETRVKSDENILNELKDDVKEVI